MHEVSLFSLHFLSTQHASPTRLHAGSIDGCAVPVRYVRPRSHHSPHEPLEKRKASISLTAKSGKRLQFACDLTPVLTETLTVRDLDRQRPRSVPRRRWLRSGGSVSSRRKSPAIVSGAPHWRRLTGPPGVTGSSGVSRTAWCCLDRLACPDRLVLPGPPGVGGIAAFCPEHRCSGGLTTRADTRWDGKQGEAQRAFLCPIGGRRGLIGDRRARMPPRARLAPRARLGRWPPPRWAAWRRRGERRRREAAAWRR